MIRGRRRFHVSRSENYDIDDNERQARFASRRAAIIASRYSGGGFDVFNNTEEGIRKGFVYGRDSSGLIALAVPGTVDPLWLAISRGNPFEDFRAQRTGIHAVQLVDGETPTIGNYAYLDEASGLATITQPSGSTDHQWVLGRFKDTEADDFGRVPVDLTIFEMRGRDV